MPHRSTIWRWRRNGKPTHVAGRRLANHNRDLRVFNRVAAFIEQAVQAGLERVDPSKQEATAFDRKAISAELRAWMMRSDLVAVAACDALRIGAQRRSRKGGHEKTVDLLVREYGERLTEKQRINFARRSGTWLRAIKPFDNRYITLSRSVGRCCPSRIFRHLSSRMVRNWRKHLRYSECKRRVTDFFAELRAVEQEIFGPPGEASWKITNSPWT